MEYKKSSNISPDRPNRLHHPKNGIITSKNKNSLNGTMTGHLLGSHCSMIHRWTNVRNRNKPGEITYRNKKSWKTNIKNKRKSIFKFRSTCRIPLPGHLMIKAAIAAVSIYLRNTKGPIFRIQIHNSQARIVLNVSIHFSHPRRVLLGKIRSDFSVAEIPNQEK